ncbi:hypothetical protein JQ557_18235 [Bradyrhizobium sp. U87765 SZCCT0131]|uniref:4-fold beta flower protein n=1 Tax=unclassified Bradyrhizobium TaxID=2631580 RepID=UPI001BAA0D98|nr:MULTISPECIES: hypothetical protein [unclassified Bradyrhizobium]MBR1219952.1 hypothetical protein [Bradyrhizobium sp. U87765 SZCCT0131]MBR1263592.1 hypothetical protein [Bradyrhizobium sp. U87765 SZCCT0134]MBR1309161.1 hypothetical protein [Bradyrhizobium sp. U87765 SZCCT0110]MBR1323924.1 hypothetical protein [Bradyrhizobium sp. U87765 SZCCT0109]MBR1349476.1 hypothetical protein [Bradyrhizobium sp. U87765 SZCCT0048]
MAVAEFYDKTGQAIAYLQDDSHIFDWDGTPTAYIRDNAVYSYPGAVIGWLRNGWIWDLNGRAVLFIPQATGGPLKPLRKLKPLKALRKLKPLKGLRQLKPLRPLMKTIWSDRSWRDLRG